MALPERGSAERSDSFSEGVSVRDESAESLQRRPLPLCRQRKVVFAAH